MSDSQKPAELFRRSLDAFLAQDMRAWADLCAEDVLVEFPFAPAGTPSRLDGRVAIFEYLRNYPKIIDVHTEWQDRRWTCAAHCVSERRVVVLGQQAGDLRLPARHIANGDRPLAANETEMRLEVLLIAQG